MGDVRQPRWDKGAALTDRSTMRLGISLGMCLDGIESKEGRDDGYTTNIAIGS